jgi:iron complex transport system ATP-binding protein
MLRIEGLTVRYGERRVLEDVSLQVQSGEVMALIGPNGAGKSTLIRAASGVVPVESGRIRTNGDEFTRLSHQQRARTMAVVPQNAGMPPAFSVWETVLMGRTPYLNFLGQVSARDEELARRALERVHADDLSARRVGELSGGEVQRVLLARALAQSAPILLLDEPTTHLDLHHQVSLLELVQSLAREDNLAVLAAIHDLNLAARFADRIALLVGGRIRAVGLPEQVLRPEVISDAYGWPVRVVEHPFLGGPLVLPEKNS